MEPLPVCARCDRHAEPPSATWMIEVPTLCSCSWCSSDDRKTNNAFQEIDRQLKIVSDEVQKYRRLTGNQDWQQIGDLVTRIKVSLFEVGERRETAEWKAKSK